MRFLEVNRGAQKLLVDLWLRQVSVRLGDDRQRSGLFLLSSFFDSFVILQLAHGSYMDRAVLPTSVFNPSFRGLRVRVGRQSSLTIAIQMPVFLIFQRLRAVEKFLTDP